MSTQSAQRKVVEVNEENDPNTWLTVAQKKKLESFNRWSEKFRYLHAEGFETKHIAKITGKIYQQVRNTLVGPVPKTTK